MQIRSITIDDYPKLIDFWKENYFVNEMDQVERFKIFLEKNPQLSLLMEYHSEIVGTVLVSFDGRRGYLQKVVTKNSLRHKGIGQQMVTEALKRLKQINALYIPINCDLKVMGFYEKCGFKTTQQMPMNIHL